MKKILFLLLLFSTTASAQYIFWAHQNNLILPTLSSGILSTDGTSLSWIAASVGTVTSVAISGNNGLGITSGSPITGSGTIALKINNGGIGDSSLASTFLKANQTITLGTDLSGSGTTTLNATIVAGAVTLAKMANMATASLIYRKTAGSGAPEVNTLAQLKTDLTLVKGDVGLGNVENTALSTWAGTSNITTVGAAAITLANMANMATASLIYRKTAGSGVPEVNTLATLKTDLLLTGTNTGDQTITLTGNVTGSGTGSFATTIANLAVTNAMIAATTIDLTAKVTGILPFANGGQSAAAATTGTTGTISVPMTTELITITPTGACTFNGSGGIVGQTCTFIVTTSGTSSFVLTWGTNYKTTGTLATGTTTAKTFCVTFRCLSTTQWYEIGRTVAE